jgi:hypothetical protein
MKTKKNYKKIEVLMTSSLFKYYTTEDLKDCNPTLVYNGETMTLNFDKEKFKSLEKVDKSNILKHMEFDFKQYELNKCFDKGYEAKKALYDELKDY